MKVTVKRQEATEKLSIMSKIVRKNSIMPALEGIIVLSNSEDQIEVKGSNLRTNLTLRITAAVEGSGTYIIPLKGLLDILRRLPDEYVVLHFKESEVKLYARSSEYSFRTYIPDEYPDVAWNMEGIRLSIASKDILECLGETSFATSPNSEYAPSYSQGVQVEVSKDRITVAASDGQRLAVSHFSVDDATEDIGTCAIPILSLNEITPVISGSEIIDLIFGDRYVAIESSLGVAVLSKLNVRIPDYGPVIKKATSVDENAIFDRIQLVGVLDRLMSVSSDSYLVKASFNDTSTFETVGLSSGAGSERVECEYSGNPITVHFSIRHVLGALKSLNEEKVVFFIQDSMVAIRKCSTDNFVYVVSTASVAEEGPSESE